MDEFETKFIESQQNKPLVWFRYIDDIFFIWTHGEEKLKTFLESLNNFEPYLKFTHEFSKENIPFLDLKVKLVDGKIKTDLYIKETDRHQYLHYSSSHPNHTKRSIVFSQGLRIKRICSEEEDFNTHIGEMKSWFQKRAYPEKVIDKELGKISFSYKGSKNSRKNKGIPFVVTYHPLLQELSNIITKNLNWLYADDEVKKLFSPGPMVSFRSARKLSSYLVRAKIYPLQRDIGSCKCGKKRCQVCQNIVETDSFSSTCTGKTYKINHQFNCSDKCLIYLLTCKTCLKQYVGQTVDEFRYRWNNYKCNDKKYLKGQSCFQEHIFEHFNSPGHNGFLEDVSIILIDKTDPSDPEKREDYWIQTLKTAAPWGLNVM